MSIKKLHSGIVLLIDSEFTCWEGSLASGWSDPDFPAEIIEVGIIAYQPVTQKRIAHFSSLAKPIVNPELSDYALDLLPITQDEIDNAPSYTDMIEAIKTWILAYADPDSPTVGWGLLDRRFITLHGERCGVSDPFGDRPHIAMDVLAKTALGIERSMNIEREFVRDRFGLKDISDRHRALNDAEDLISFDKALQDWAQQIKLAQGQSNLGTEPV
ncbi:3'-5' exonuclease [Candidatus Lucifugimonas marina]|uniref:Exonuclease domain-containing protein n=1 Tax=Candidatus Lucifugimonas marina TaxID=3038979 RepID=A0AAJ6CUK7_9CHLR|nr:hypothetical protein [SAR202 cluster bacterium JH702]MDG0868275.1 hypothetical protein [SAR202 cluster bacterium JH639]WFG34919.1 hypothetical protein GKN94_04190 [SAR202 cluster bacterium JH545]WFG38870.1 hypothetical protein GKO48_04325 [SAR202 cluster bacterium JH1073]